MTLTSRTITAVARAAGPVEHLSQGAVRGELHPGAGSVPAAEGRNRRPLWRLRPVEDHAPILTDEPKLLAGADTAPNPVELVLAAVGSCLAVGYTAAAAAQGIVLRSLEIEVEGDLDLQVFLGITEGHAGY